ncbi:unnamed protein product [Rotaria magnacalcarata]|uniref:Uncharacterized protein n=1 Tax=Rotaria magnacalcarata TaxID=392030 RepID=A0A816CPV5_9BILA|nr:unnamed protein product [Rotaria magnacalcarata]CAF3962032.1 unnamed protein product [Rotaria magnacalcarata]
MAVSEGPFYVNNYYGLETYNNYGVVCKPKVEIVKTAQYAYDDSIRYAGPPAGWYPKKQQPRSYYDPFQAELKEDVLLVPKKYGGVVVAAAGSYYPPPPPPKPLPPYDAFVGLPMSGFPYGMELSTNGYPPLYKMAMKTCPPDEGYVWKPADPKNLYEAAKLAEEEDSDMARALLLADAGRGSVMVAGGVRGPEGGEAGVVVMSEALNMKRWYWTPVTLKPNASIAIKTPDDAYYLAYKGFGNVAMQREPYFWRTDKNGALKQMARLKLVRGSPPSKGSSSAAAAQDMYFLKNTTTGKVFSMLVGGLVNIDDIRASTAKAYGFTDNSQNVPIPFIVKEVRGMGGQRWSEHRALAMTKYEEEAAKKPCAIM